MLSNGIRLTGSTGIRRIVNSMVTSKSATGIELSGWANQVTVMSTRVVNSTYSWSTGISLSSRQAMLQITDCRIEGYHTAMYLSTSTSNVLVNNCTIRHNRYRGVYVAFSVYGNQYVSTTRSLNQRLQVSNCTFSDSPVNQALFVSLYNKYHHIDLPAIITGNLFERNLQGLYLRTSPRGNSPIVARNTFIHNHGGCCSGALNVYVRNRDISTSPPVIVEQNEFIENTGEYVANLQTDVYYDRHSSDIRLVFRDNKMTDNIPLSLGGTYIKSTPNAVVLITGTLFTMVYHNTFNNLDATTELAVQVEGFSSLDRINVTLNWWGTANDTMIAERIFDFDDSNHLAVARYFPFLLSASLSDVATPSNRTHPPEFLNNNGKIGGKLTGSLTLPASGGPYSVIRDITVLSNATLVVEAGAMLKFQPYVGVLVEGSLITKGTPSQPVVFAPAGYSKAPLEVDTIVRLKETFLYGSATAGYIQIKLDEIWQPICLKSVLNNVTSINRIAYLTCQELFVWENNTNSAAYWWWHDWFPALGDPVIHDLWCSNNASSFYECIFDTSNYTPDTECLRVLAVECYNRQFQLYPRKGDSEDNRWGGVRFSSSSSTHQLSSSTLHYTEIVGAGRRIRTTVPSLQALFRPPNTVGLTIRDSASTAMEVSYLHEESYIGSIDVINAAGDGLAIHRPRGRSLIIESVTVENVTGAGIRVFDMQSSFLVHTQYQSICQGQETITVDTTEGSYVGMSQEDHQAKITCSAVLQGPPDTLLSIRLVSFRLYSDEYLYIRDGNQSYSSLLGFYHQSNSNAFYHDLLISSGNAVYVEVRTGKETGAAGFSLYVEVVPVDREPPFVSITKTTVYNSQIGVYFQDAYDDAIIHNVTVMDARNHGIYVSGHEGGLTVSKCFIVNAGNVGVFEWYGVGRKTFTNNEIVNCSQGISIVSNILYSAGLKDCNETISGNVISAAKTRAVRLTYYQYSHYSYYLDHCVYQISRNELISNNDGLLLQVYTYGSTYLSPVYLEVSKNLFSNNSGTDVSLSEGSTWNMAVTGNKFQGHRPGSQGCLLMQGYATTMKAVNNTFTGNGGEYVVRIAPENITSSLFLFTHNDLTDNYVNDSSIHQQDRRSAVLIVTQSQQFAIKHNYFNNPGSLFEVGVDIPAQSSEDRVINMSLNYWGTTDENVIIDRIHDFGYCSRLASVEYFPYLTSPSGQPVSSSVARTQQIVRPNGIVRGRVASDTTLFASGNPYVVTGDISVLPGRKLTIEAGVELRFTHNTGILVEGQLAIHGMDGSQVLLTDDSLAVGGKKEGSLRLVGGSSSLTGRVEVFHNGSWGSVCVVRNLELWLGYGWWPSSHDRYNNIVICRELGYTGARWMSSYSDASETDSSKSAWLEHVLCRGSEDTLRQCTNYILEKATCPYGQLVASCYMYNSYVPELKSDKSFTHWTGIRFAAGATGMSSLLHVAINSAGIANAGHIPAIQCIGANVSFFNVTVDNSAWTAMEITHSPFLNISHSTISNSDGNGVQLTNMAASSLSGVTSRENSGHGVTITVDSIVQRMWNIPILHGKIVDICAHAGTLSATTPFFLRFMFSRTRRGWSSQHCTATVQSTPQHVLSVHIMAIRFQEHVYMTTTS